MTALVIDFHAATGRRAPAVIRPTAPSGQDPAAAGHRVPRKQWLPFALAMAAVLVYVVATQILLGQVPLRGLAAVGLLVFGNAWAAANGGAAEAVSGLSDPAFGLMV